MKMGLGGCPGLVVVFGDRDGGFLSRRVGRPLWVVGCEPVELCGRPCDLPGCAASANP
jgi:hypothetical protein